MASPLHPPPTSGPPTSGSPTGGSPAVGSSLGANVPYAAGDRIADRYVIEQLLGRGGMGIVLRAFDERLHRAVALKVLPASAHLDGLARARMLREARSAAALEHPGIVQVYDAGDTGDGGTFIAMELVRGRSLRDAARAGALDPTTLARLVRDIGATLASAHRQGLVHRDIKPDNIMLRDDGRIVVLDFGLAKPAVGVPDAMALTGSGNIVGTPAYLSPEQARSEVLTGASDQFSLAVTFFELLTGRLPWVGETPTAVLAAMLLDEPLRAAELVPSIPGSVDEVLRRALAKAPSERFADCEELGRALASAIEEQRGQLGLLDTMAAPTPASIRAELARSSSAGASSGVGPGSSASEPTAPGGSPATAAAPSRRGVIAAILAGGVVVSLLIVGSAVFAAGA